MKAQSTINKQASPNKKANKYGNKELDKKQNYPQSKQSQIKSPETKKFKQLSEEQQKIVRQYIESVSGKQFKELLKERQEFLQKLQNINNHLNQMITQIYGNLNFTQGHIQGANIQNSQKKSERRRNKQPWDSRVKNGDQKIDTNRYDTLNGQFQHLSVQQISILEKKNQKLMENLRQQIQDYEFMLTGQYWEKLDEEILKEQASKKSLLHQICSLDKDVKKHTKTYDKEIITKLQKFSYDTEVQLTLLNKKLQSKASRLASIENQNKSKLQKISKLSLQESQLQKLLQIYEGQQCEGLETRYKKQNFQKLQVKKEKLEKIINSFNNNNLRLYNKKLSEFRDLVNIIQKSNDLIRQMDENIFSIVKQRKELQQTKKTSIPLNRKMHTEPDLKKRQINIMNNVKLQNKHNISFLKKNRQKFLSDYDQFKTDDRNFKGLSFQQQNHELLREQQNKQRRRIYTELENSHYFSSMEKKVKANSVLSNQLESEQQDRIGNYKQKNLVFQKNQQHLQNMPTLETVINLPERQSKPVKIQQKKFNRNVIFPKTLESSNQEKVQPSNNFNQRSSSMKLNNQRLNNSKSSQRKGMPEERQIESEDQIQKRLLNLEKSLKKEKKLTLFERMQQSLEEEESDAEPYEINIKNTVLKKFSPSVSRGFMKQKQTAKLKNKNPSHHYKELCKELGKERLLIEEDTDIAGLIYEGMALNQYDN